MEVFAIKASELIKELEKYPDFEVWFSTSRVSDDGWLDVQFFKNIGIGDIGHSDKIINLTDE